MHDRNQGLLFPVTTKLCTKCRTIKDVSLFSRDRAAKDGLHSQCKECQRNRRQSIPVEQLPKLKHCNQCGRDLPRSAFTPRRQSWDGLRPECRECRNKRQHRDWRKDLPNNRAKAAAYRRRKYAADPERGRAEAKAWRDKHPKPKKPKIRLNPEEKARRKKESRKRTYEKNKEKVLAQAAIYRATHKMEERANRAAHYQRNKEHVARTTKAYREANRPLYAAAGAKRRAAELKATPLWANLKAIAAMYEEAARITKETGIPHEVDHIYPLQSKYLCGLHVETNLQIIPRGPNRSKSNHRWPGMEWCLP